MKKFLDWLTGFFDSEKTQSSKRLVGIIGAMYIFVAMYKNATSVQGTHPADSLVWGTVTLVCIALGLTSIKEVSDIIRAIKGGDKKKEE